MIFISLAKSHPSPTYGFQLDCAEKRSETSLCLSTIKKLLKNPEMSWAERGSGQQPSLYLPPLAQSNALNLEMEKQRPREGRSFTFEAT